MGADLVVLLKCPFCGGDPRHVKPEQFKYRIICDTCKFTLDCSSPEIWNRRVPLSATAAMPTDADPQGTKRLFLGPSPEMIEAGAQRLVRWETGNEKWPDAWSKLDVRAARNDAEKVWLSMWLAAPSFTLETTAPNARAVAEKCAEIAERPEGHNDHIWYMGTVRFNRPNDVLRRRAAEIRAYAATLPVSESATQQSSQALTDIAAERQRQIEKEGWTHEHDDGHVCGAMAVAGACYALDAAKQITEEHHAWSERYEEIAGEIWPWDLEWWKPKDPRRDLVRAAALIAAEIDRLDRAGSSKEVDE